HCLSVRVAKHRVALIHLILSDHCLTIKQLRHHKKYFLPCIPKEDRLCHFCLKGIETPEHTLLLCTSSNDVIESWTKSFLILIPLFPTLPLSHITPGNARWVLKKLILTSPTIYLVAKFIWEILQIFGSTPIYLPDSSIQNLMSSSGIPVDA
ncbi:hypothetical protein ARMGADRAFT_1144449, partial [Armillaria gallica]